MDEYKYLLMRPTAVYLIAASPDGPTKLGISIDPRERLRQLQCASSESLSLYGLFWLKNRQLAKRAEAWLLKELYGSRRMRGEWLNKPARELSPFLAGLLSIKFKPENILDVEEHFVMYATDEEVLGLVKPRHGVRATPEQLERLGIEL